MRTSMALALALSLVMPTLSAQAEVTTSTGKTNDVVPVQASPPVQVAPPAQRPYGQRSTPQQPNQGQYGRRLGQAQSFYTEFRILPAPETTAWIYDGDALIGSIGAGSGTIFLPRGQAYGVVLTRGDRVVWQGHIMATPGIVGLSWDRYGSPVVERAPPPPMARTRPFGTNQPMLQGQAFRDVLAQLEAYPDDRSRLGLVDRYFFNRPVTIGQASDILGRFAFDESRLTALEIIAPNLMSGGDPARLVGMFSFPGSRDQAAAILGVPQF